MTEETYFCCDCRTYGSKREMLENHRNLGHMIKKRSKPEDRIIHGNKGSITVKVDDDVYAIICVLHAFSSPSRNIDGFSDPNLSLMSALHNWEYRGSCLVHGDLNNVSKKLSMTVKVTPQELADLFIQAIKRNRVEETSNPNIVKAHICLSSDLELKPKDSTSKWLVTTARQIRKCFTDPTEAYKKMRERAREVSTQKVVGA